MASHFRRSMLFAFLWPERARVALLGLVLLSGIALQLASPQIVRAFIDRAESGAAADYLIGLAVLFIAAAFLTQGASVIETYLAEEIGWRTTNALRADLTRHVLTLDDTFHAAHGAGELIERIDGDVSAVAEFFSRFVVQVVGGGVLLVGMLALLLQADWRAGALLSAFAAIALIYMRRGGGFVAIRASQARQSAADVIDFVTERLAGLPDVKSSGADGDTMRRLDGHLAARVERAWAASRAGTLFNSVVSVIFVVGLGAALALSVWLHDRGAITLGTIYLIVRYAGMVRQPLERLSQQMHSLQQAAGGLTRIGDLLATRSRVISLTDGDLPPGPLALAIDRVSFRYDTAPVLSGISLSLAPGETLGLLGRTGSGKTTIARLLFRTIDPVGGAIRLGGRDLRDVSLATLRDRVGFVTQDVQILHATLRDNVTLFDATVSDARLDHVVANLGLSDWVHGLPNGLETVLGAGERELSAGEAQIVALARVFLKEPGLIILDEASSRIDPATERFLDAAIDRLLAGRTAVVIAHRVATLDRVDRIAILADGAIVESGRRAELAADPDSRFARLRQSGLTEALA